MKTQFYKPDEQLKRLSRDQRWADFHRACGRCGLFFDVQRSQGGGYGAVGFRATQDRSGCYAQVIVCRGSGKDPVAAVTDAYQRAVAANDPVQVALDEIFAGSDYPQPQVAGFDVAELIG